MLRAVVVGLMALAICAFSAVVLLAGIDETGLALSGARHDLRVGELAAARGWVGVYGCVRHDLAVGVSRQREVYRLGEASTINADDEVDRVFTPLAAREDCSEDQPPKKIYALVENDDSLGSTITHVYQQKVAPPPVPAIVNGVVGYGVGHRALADAARAWYAAKLGLVLDEQPLLVKGKQPGVLWVALVTAAAGAHGFVFAGLAVWWLFRRERRRRALLSGQESLVEEEFFRSETLE